MFFNSVKSCEVKKCKVDKHMELGLYRQPNYSRNKYSRTQIKWTSQGMHVKILICSKCWKNSTSGTASSLMSSIFQENHVFFQPPNFLLPQNNFQLSADLFNSNNSLSVLFRFVFYQVVLKNAIRVLQCIQLSYFYFMRSRLEGNF